VAVLDGVDQRRRSDMGNVHGVVIEQESGDGGDVALGHGSRRSWIDS
jgi:hypothetical protein